MKKFSQYFVIFQDSYNQYFYEDVRLLEYRDEGEDKKVKYFVNRKLKYLWSTETFSYELLRSV